MNTAISKFLVSLFCFSITFGLCGQVPFFCVEKGTKLGYVKTCPDGDVEGYSEMVILDVTGNVEAGDTVGSILYSFNMFDKKRVPESVLPVGMRIDFSSVGLVVDMGENMASMLRSMMGDGAVAEEDVTGEPSVFPFEMKPGDVLADHSYSVKVKFISIHVSTSQRRVLREEVITTEAGTFQCMVMQESVVVKSLGISKRSKILTWCARGVGTVRQEAYGRRGKLESVEVLCSLVN